MEHEYPQYYEVQDVSGEPFAVIAMEGENFGTIIQPRSGSNTFTMTRISHLDQVPMVAAGEMVGVHAIDFDKTVKEWRIFNLSDAILNATIAAGIEQPKKAEPNVIDPEVLPPPVIERTEGTNEDGADNTTEPQTTDESGNGLSEQPAPEDTGVAEPNEFGDVESEGTGGSATTTEPQPDNESDNKNLLSEDTPTES